MKLGSNSITLEWAEQQGRGRKEGGRGYNKSKLWSYAIKVEGSEGDASAAAKQSYAKEPPWIIQ